MIAKPVSFLIRLMCLFPQHGVIHNKHVYYGTDYALYFFTPSCSFIAAFQAFSSGKRSRMVASWPSIIFRVV